MGLMDKVKAQAAVAAQKAQEAAQQGKDKLDQAQASRRGDAMLRQLGTLVFAERTGRAAADSQAKIDQLVSDLSAHEQSSGASLVGDQSQPFRPQPNFPADPPSPFPGPVQQNEYGSGGGSTTFPDASSTSFPDAGPSTPPESGQSPQASSTSFPTDTAPRFFPGSHPDDEPGQGGTSAFPPES